MSFDQEGIKLIMKVQMHTIIAAHDVPNKIHKIYIQDIQHMGVLHALLSFLIQDITKCMCYLLNHKYLWKLMQAICYLQISKV